MDSTIAGGVTADYVRVYGDWQHFVLVNRLGTRAEALPHFARGEP
jgi:hypothetical protein